MDKRAFIRLSGLGIAGSMMQCVNPFSFAKSASKIILPSRWVWMRPDSILSMEHWNKQFATLAESGIQAILPQVYASRETLFEHPYLPMKKNWLEKILPIAHKHGLEVHAWMWSMPLNDPDLIKKHPDWFSVNRNGQPAHTHPAYVDYYKFLDPCHPEVQEHVASVVRALANIEDLDGIHLDYIRQPDVILAKALQPKYNIVQDKEYPAYDYPYSSYCREAFQEESGIDPMDLGDEAPYNEAWRQFRYSAISSLVNDHLVPEARKKNKAITAAVFPNWESVRQAWHQWDLDGFLPMLYNGFYNEDIKWIGEEVAQAKVRLANDKPVYSGLYMPDVSDPKQLREAIKVAKNRGADGFALFSLNNLKAEHYAILQELTK